MPAYSFKEQFIEPIQKGDKQQTIRGKRKNQAKVGNTLYLYYGMRTKWCTKIGEAICTDVHEIVITKNGAVTVGKKKLNAIEKYALAKADGFADFNSMIDFWKKNNSLPFVGDIIYWEQFKKHKA